MQERIGVQTPSHFRECYTTYYSYESSDSPFESRQYLIGKLLGRVGELIKDPAVRMGGKKVQLLSVGAGRQLLEREMAADPVWQQVSPYINIFTIDIADLSSAQMFYDYRKHVIGNAAMLPFADNCFDVVFSNLAIDFMPKSAYSEVARVVKHEGTFMVNFHHPNLIEKARGYRHEAERKVRSCKKKVQFGIHSKKIRTYEENLRLAQMELADVDFVIHDFPQLIFNSKEEISAYMEDNFHFWYMRLEEHANNSTANGWFFMEAQGFKEKSLKENAA